MSITKTNKKKEQVGTQLECLSSTFGIQFIKKHYAALFISGM